MVSNQAKKKEICHEIFGANHVKFIEEFVSTEKHVLVKR